MLEDDLTEFPPRYDQPRKVHLFHDNKGATFGPRNKPFANTLCRMNSSSSDMQTTTDPALVTCKICLRDRRFRELTAPPAPSPVQRQAGRRTRYRVSFWTRKLILQVEDAHHIDGDSLDPLDMGRDVLRWRDARLEDLGRGVV